MIVTLYQDNTLSLDLDCIIDNLNRLAPSFRFHKGHESFSISDSLVESPETYQRLPDAIHKETRDSGEVYLFTNVPYDNNYFWESVGKEVIVSFYGWERLTSLSRNNGAVYFICAVIIGTLGFRELHQENTGCINDFWQDKTGVDIGMKAAFICPACRSSIKETASDIELSLVEQVQVILNELSIASRYNIDVCDFWRQGKQDHSFDVFLCYNSSDKCEIRVINEQLKQRSIITWFDEDQLPPGRLWQELLEENIEQVKTAAIFVGASEIGPWQNMEVRAFLQEFVRRRCPVIPVILSSCSKVPQLPLFLSQLTWVDFRKSIPDPLAQLIWGITGKNPRITT